MSEKKSLISLVIPIYNESKSLSKLHKRIGHVADEHSSYEWEFVLVNDGSSDNSWELIQNLCKNDSRCKGVDLSRNFGKEIALSAGLHVTTGDAVICLDADLQHPPEVIPEMLMHWKNGAEVVATIRRSIAKQPMMRKAGSHLYYWIMTQLSEIEVMSQTTDFRLIDRKVVKAFRSVGERQRMYRGIIDWLGFKKVWIEFDAGAREHGIAVYSYKKLFMLALDSLLSYSSVPLKFIGILGFLIIAGSALLLVWMQFARLVFGETFYYTPLAKFVVANTFLMGIILLALGMMSLYIGKIYSEVLQRPLFVVREFSGFSDKSSEKSSMNI